MGEKQIFQPLTREDIVTVVLYRAGIVLSAIILVLGFLLSRTSNDPATARLSADILGYGLYASVGMCVFFIHLYVGVFKTYLKNLYYISLGCLVVLLIVGKGAPSSVLGAPYGPLLLLPLSGCLGVVTAKEAFCFRISEGYLLAMIMPAYLLLVSAGALSRGGAIYGLAAITALFVIFTLRKAFMPLAYDIGDKSAYR